jgi:hypothetical protein
LFGPLKFDDFFLREREREESRPLRERERRGELPAEREREERRAAR